MSTYTPPSQITQRQLDYFQGKHVLMAGEVEDDFCAELTKHCQSVAIFTTHFGYHQQFKKHQHVRAYFGEQLDTEIEADLLLFYWPKSKPEAKYLLAMLMDKLYQSQGKGFDVIVVGENRSGVKSIETFFEPYGEIKKYDSARRCSFYVGECTQTPEPFNINDWYKTFEINAGGHNSLVTGGHNLLVKSLPGVFSHGELDLGTQLLLENLPKLQGDILDVGCGAGIIGSMIALRNPQANVTMCDVSALALASTKATLAKNNLTAHVIASDVYSHAAENYQAIVTNPPFHSGLETSYSAAQNLINQAPTHLTKNGQLILVANRFLKYPDLLERTFGTFETIDQTTKFSLYQMIKK